MSLKTVTHDLVTLDALRAAAGLLRGVAVRTPLLPVEGLAERAGVPVYVKPENIMVCKDAAGVEHAVVMDFGLAKERQTGAERQKLTATGIILGTPEFMSPEQLRGKPLDARSDIFALSLMAYEMLTGKLPWEGRNAQEMMVARLRQEPTPARTRRPDLPHGVDAVLLKAIARAPADRDTTAAEFARALRQAAE